MVMRVGGLASGMDIEAMVQKLMEAERVPLTKLQQKQTNLTWKTEAFRDINSKLLDLDKMMINMKLSTTYKPKSAVSSQENAVTATAKSGATLGSYNVEVTQLATNEVWAGALKRNSDGEIENGTFDIKYGEETFTIDVDSEEDLKSISNQVKKESGGAVRAFYDEVSDKVIVETTQTGENNKITVSSNNVLDFGDTPIQAGKDAKFTYNGVEFSSNVNSYTLNDITFEFNDVTDGNARITVSSNVDEAFDNITNFVEKYNEAIDAMNKSQTEERYRDFPPLTEEQKSEMTEKQIEQWEEKAKSGILRGESTIRDGMYKLRQSLQSHVDTGGEYNLLSQIGITTTKNYLDGGKLEIDETKLKTALRENPDDVYKLFSNSDKEGSRGLINRFDDSLDLTKGQIERKAGNSTHTLENYSIGKEIKEVNKRITVFEKRMIQVEQRYWNQFNAMESAISKLNQQADYLFSQFGGGM